MAEALTETQLSAIIAQQIGLARTHDQSERAGSRDKALDYYFGNMDKYVPPEENRSKTVSRDVADTIGRMLPGIIRVFTASGQMAIAEPVGPEDEEFARQATLGLNYVFWKDNNGYGLVYAATWDALLQGNGIVKTFYDPTPVYTTSFHSGLTEDQVALLLQPNEDGDEPEVLASTKRAMTLVDPATNTPFEVPVFDLKIKRVRAPGTFIVDVVPPEEFLIDAEAVETAEAAFTDHWQRKTRSSLVAMGYDKDVVSKIPEASRLETPEQTARQPDGLTWEATDTSMQLVDYHECYIRVDVDGDGEAELVRACYGGAGGSGNGELLDWEVWEDEHPFDDIKCEPIPHRWLARSVADETMDVQDVKTVLSRQLLNGIYWGNNPQNVIAGKVENPEALLSPQFGQPIFAAANTTVTPLQRGQVGDIALQGIAYEDEVLTRRTGISKQTMALDPETLQNQTATAANIEHDASYSQTELVARNMAEWGWSKVFRKLMKLMIKHQEYSRQVMFNGKQVVIDPRQWNADMHVTINVGLGTGSRDRDLLMLKEVLNGQLLLADRFMAAGDHDDAIDLLPKVIETMTRMAEAAGIRNAEDYYPEFTADKVAQLKQVAAEQANQPDPAIALEQAKGQTQMQLKQADVASQQQIEQGRQQTQQQLNSLESERQVRQEQAQLQADLATKEADRQNALQLEAVKQQGAIQIESMRIASQERMKVAELEHQRSLEQARMANSQTLAAMKPQPGQAG